MLAFGIPPTTKEEPAHIRKALVDQVRAFIEGDVEETDDIVAMLYQQYLTELESEENLLCHMSSLYPDDIVYIQPDHK